MTNACVKVNAFVSGGAWLHQLCGAQQQMSLMSLLDKCMCRSQGPCVWRHWLEAQQHMSYCWTNANAKECVIVIMWQMHMSRSMPWCLEVPGCISGWKLNSICRECYCWTNAYVSIGQMHVSKSRPLCLEALAAWVVESSTAYVVNGMVEQMYTLKSLSL